MQDSDRDTSFDDHFPEDDPYYTDPHFDHEARGEAQLRTETARYFLALPDPPDDGPAPDMSVDELFEEAADSAGADRIAARARMFEPGPLTAQMLEVIKPSRLSPSGLLDAACAAERLASWTQATQHRHLAAFARPGVAVPVEQLKSYASAPGKPLHQRSASQSATRPDDGSGADQDLTSSGSDVHGDSESQAALALMAFKVAAAELSAALRVSPISANRRVAQAVDFVDDLPATLTALQCGAIDRGRSLVIADRTQNLPTDLRHKVEAIIVPKAATRTAGQVRGIADRAVIAADPDAARKRQEVARRNRSVSLRAAEDGMSHFRADLPADKACTAFTVIDQLAIINSRNAAELRSIGALRADAFADIFDQLADHGSVHLHTILGKGHTNVDPRHPCPRHTQTDTQAAEATGTRRADMATETHTDGASASGSASSGTAAGAESAPTTGSESASSNTENACNTDVVSDTDAEAGCINSTTTTTTTPGTTTSWTGAGTSADMTSTHTGTTTGAKAGTGGTSTPGTTTDAAGTTAAGTTTAAAGKTTAAASVTDGTTTPGTTTAATTSAATTSTDEPTGAALNPERAMPTPPQGAGTRRPATVTECGCLPDTSPTSPTSPLWGLGTHQGRTIGLNVTIAANTLAGLDDLPGELDGHGWIPADLARALAVSASTITAVAVNAACGTALDLGRTTYRPRLAQRDYVNQRDQTCRFPSCRQPAWRCQLDHSDEFCPGKKDGGITCPCNLKCLCKFHHDLKTFGLWDTEHHPDDSITWTSPIGRTYTTQTREWLTGMTDDRSTGAVAAELTGDSPDLRPANHDGVPTADDNNEEPPF